MTKELFNFKPNTTKFIDVPLWGESRNVNQGRQLVFVLNNVLICPVAVQTTAAPAVTVNEDDERLIQVAVPLAVVLFLVILILIYTCHKLHRKDKNGGQKFYNMEHF